MMIVTRGGHQNFLLLGGSSILVNWYKFLLQAKF